MRVADQGFVVRRVEDGNSQSALNEMGTISRREKR